MKLSNIINKKTEILSKLDTERIYVENVRSFFNLPYKLAKLYCEMAVKQHYFDKKIGVICPNEECNRIVLVVDKKSQIPETVECDHCRLLERDEFEFHPTEKNIIEFYKLNKEH